MTKSYFIAGVGTGIGKTMVTAALTWQLRHKGKSVMALKPIISGWEDGSDEMDTIQLLRSVGADITAENIDATSPWRLTAPLSPDMAASEENKVIDFSQVVDFCKNSIGKTDYSFIEGVGGVMVPINSYKTTIDLMHELQVRVILVTGSYLGAISHTLTALEALKSRGISVYAIIINESKDSVGLQQIKNSISNFTDINIINNKYVAGEKDIWKKMEEISL